MFTGIIEELGNIRRFDRNGMSKVLVIGCNKILQDLKTGDSVAVNGICLTAISMGKDYFCADVMPETLEHSNLGMLKAGDPVALERALRLSDRLGGHIVSGHIDGVGVICNITQDENAVRVSVRMDCALLRYVVQKGSITIDGTSLTVATVTDEMFSVSLIPLTIKLTTLGHKKIGDAVNIECDILGKYIDKLMGDYKDTKDTNDPISLDFLKNHGFV